MLSKWRVTSLNETWPWKILVGSNAPRRGHIKWIWMSSRSGLWFLIVAPMAGIILGPIVLKTNSKEKALTIPQFNAPLHRDQVALGKAPQLAHSPANKLKKSLVGRNQMTHPLRPAFALRTGSLESEAEWDIPAQNQTAYFATSKMSKNLNCAPMQIRTSCTLANCPNPLCPSW